MNSRSLKLILEIIGVAIFISCTSNNQLSDKIKTLESVAEKAINRQLNIPDSLIIYSPFSSNLSYKDDLFDSEYKIYSNVDASCGTCIGEINAWNELAPKFDKFKVPVILICHSNDNFVLLKYFCENGEIGDFKFPFFLDYSNDFVEINEFMSYNKNFETVLTDRDNNVLALGNPIHSVKILEIYLNIIDKGI